MFVSHRIAESDMKKKILWFWVSYVPSNQSELRVNFKTNYYYQGNFLFSREPDYVVTESTFSNIYIHVVDTMANNLGNLDLTYDDGWQNLTHNMEPRSGNLFNWDLSGAAVWYTNCN